MGNSFLTGNPMQKNPDGSFSLVTSGVGNPPLIVAAFDTATPQQANIASTPLYTVPAGRGGTYRVQAYAVLTQAATTSSTLPGIFITYTDSDTNISLTFLVTNQSQTSNTIGTSSNAGSASQNSTVYQVKAGTVINVGTQNYASVGATPMQYVVHVKLEYLGA